MPTGCRQGYRVMLWSAMDWDNNSVLVVILTAFASFVAVALKWLRDNAVTPIVKAHVLLVDELRESVPKQTESLKKLVEQGSVSIRKLDDQTAEIKAQHSESRVQTHELIETSRILHERTAGFVEMVKAQTELVNQNTKILSELIKNRVFLDEIHKKIAKKQGGQ